MQITWTYPAMRSLKKIYEFRKQFAGIPAARKFRKKIFDAVKRLENAPKIGRPEQSLLEREKEHRSILENKCRIYYRIEANEIFIVAVFDTRQDPDKLIF